LLIVLLKERKRKKEKKTSKRKKKEEDQNKVHKQITDQRKGSGSKNEKHINKKREKSSLSMYVKAP